MRFRLVPFRSPLLGESLRFLFLQVLRWFSSLRLAPSTLYIQMEVTDIQTRRVFPFGHPRVITPVIGSSRLFADYRVLHRHLLARHPPCALSILTTITLILSFRIGCIRFRRRPQSEAVLNVAKATSAASSSLRPSRETNSLNVENRKCVFPKKDTGFLRRYQARIGNMLILLRTNTSPPG